MMETCKLHGEYSVFCSECDEELIARHGHDNYSEIIILREKVQIMREGLNDMMKYNSMRSTEYAKNILIQAGFSEDIE